MLIKKRFYYLLLPALLALLSSCGHLMHLDRAQNNFNRGASLENQLRFNPQSDISISPSTYYTLAHAELDKALANKKSLSNDNVLASAYTIKALCEWKLMQYEKAKRSADDALEELEVMRKKGLRLPRDKALMQALPFLIEIDKVKDTLEAFHSSPPPFDSGKTHYLEFIFDPDEAKMARLEEAINEIGRIQSTVASNEELSAYFVMAQLAALKTWSDALNDLITCIANDPGLKGAENKPERDKARDWRKEQRKNALEEKESEMLILLKKFIPGDRGDQLVQYWSELI